MIYLYVWLMGLMDRARGDGFNLINRTVEKLTYGWIVAALVGYPLHWLTPLIVGTFAVGASFGWGSVIAPALGHPSNTYERWQIGPLKKNVWLAAVARGVLWGLPTLPLTYFDQRIASITVAYTIAFPLALVLTKVLPDKLDLWAAQEYLRGWLAGLIILFLVYYL